MRLQAGLELLLLDGILGLLGHLEVLGARQFVDLLPLPIMAPDEPPEIRRHHRPVPVAHEEIRTHRDPTMLRVTEVQVDHDLNEVVLIDVILVVAGFFIFFFREVAVV